MLPPMRVRRYVLSTLALPLALAACNKEEASADGGSTTPDQAATDAAPTWALPVAGEKELTQTIAAAVDASADPCVDFYQYACGGWIEATELPADKPRYGRGFGELTDRNDAVLKTIVAELGTGDDEAGKAGRYYASCMNTEARNKLGIEPLKPYLKKIDKVKSLTSLMKVTGELHGDAGANAFFNFGPGFDSKKPDLWITDLNQGGTGLPDRSFYLDEAKKPILLAYTGHVATMLAFAYEGDAERAKADATKIVALETKLAEIQKPREDLRDPIATYNRLDRKGVEKLAKGLSWKTYFKALGYPKVELINVSVPSFIEALPKVLKDTDNDTLKAYLRYHLVSGSAQYLSEELEMASFQFTAALTGQKEQAPKWKRCLDDTNGAMGDIIGKKFVEKQFAGESKTIAIEMILAIEGALEANLPKLEWMDDATRTAALGKIKKVKNKIGFPNKWRDYSKLEAGEVYTTNAQAAGKWSFERNMDKVGTEVDPEEWFLPASIVNAFYNPLQNEMNFPAGIMQAPFFSADHPKAMNYGAMGMVMGHELTHGFDDQGRKFDGDGVMQEWWSPEVSTRFDERTACIEKAYSDVEVQPGVNINGKLTMGENIADHGGIRESFSAYRALVAKDGAEAQAVEGLSNEQLFFLSYAQSWCSIATPEIEKLLITVDPHSPPKARVNLPLAHYPEFWDVWSCGEGTAMHSANACEVW